MSLKQLPIKRKLVAFVLLTSLSVLLASYLVLLSYETRSYKHTTATNLETIAEIIAANSTAVLLYDDAKLAREILSGVRAEPDIVAAALFDVEGRLYAYFPATTPPSAFPATPGADRRTFGLHELILVRPVIEGERRVGTLYLKSNLGAMYRRLGVYGFVLLAVLAGSTALAFFLSNFLQRQISGPILALARTAKIFSEQKDYSVRATKTSDDEIGALTDAFNGMLDQIRQNHAALGESERRFREVADSAPVLIWLAALDQSRTWFNKHWLDFVGHPLEQELGDGWVKNMHPEDKDRYLGSYRAAFARREPFRLEYRLRRRDGQYRWVLAHGVPRTQGGEFVGFIGTCIDITTRKEAEAAARTSELHMRLVTDHASVCLCQIDRDHRFKFANRAYAARYGRKPEEVVGRHLSEIIGAEPYALALPWIDATFAGERQDFEIELPYTDLGRRWVHLVYVPERSLDGDVVGLVSVITDTTERRRAELELERARDEAVAASRAKDDFLAALSHELRTPLSPVLLVASDAAENPNLPAAVRADFETIRKNVELEARLIDDLLDLTRITRGKLTLDLAPVEVHAVLRDAIATVQSEISAKQLSLETKLVPDDSLVWGDPVRLQQVFWNVLKNAVKFTDTNGKITVATERVADEGLLRVEITDTGIGMTPGEIARVFEAFAQGDHASAGGSHRFGGLGLGLAISRKVVELHAGRISVTSPGRNLGCCFRIELPLAAKPQVAADEPAEPPLLRKSIPPFVEGKQSRGSILLVEDHAPTRATVELLLARRGYRVISVGSIDAARKAAEKEKLHLVISDIGLPDGSGLDLMADLKQRFGLKGIALSGYGMDDDVNRSHSSGFVVHLIKPVRVQALDEALEKAAEALSGQK